MKMKKWLSSYSVVQRTTAFIRRQGRYAAHALKYAGFNEKCLFLYMHYWKARNEGTTPDLWLAYQYSEQACHDIIGHLEIGPRICLI